MKDIWIEEFKLLLKKVDQWDNIPESDKNNTSFILTKLYSIFNVSGLNAIEEVFEKNFPDYKYKEMTRPEVTGYISSSKPKIKCESPKELPIKEDLDEW